MVQDRNKLSIYQLTLMPSRGGRRIWPARGKRAAFSINPGHAPCNVIGIRGFGPGCPPPETTTDAK